MSWPNFLAPWWGLMGLLAVPLVALYLLKVRRPAMEISSTLLWSKALADMRASTPFQKLRRNLLLLLQLLILAALVFTLMRPVIQAQAGQTRAGVIVIDATASMQALDGGGGVEGPEGAVKGETRLERAKAEAKKLVATMRPGDRFKLIADGGGLNRVGYDFLSSKSELNALIDSVKASDGASDLSESLILAAESLRAIGGQQGGTDSTVVAGKVWLFSDGVGVRVPDVVGKSGELLQFVKVGASDHSLGVTQLSVTPVPKEPNTYQVFVGLRNAWETERRVRVLLAYGEKDSFLPGQAQAVTVAPRGLGSMVFEKVNIDVTKGGGGKLFVRVEETDDDFLLDNTAFGIVEPGRNVKVALVTRGNQILENFVKSGVKVGDMDARIVTPEAFAASGSGDMIPDLVILDRIVPAVLPKVDTLFMRPDVRSAGGGGAEVAGFKLTGEIADPTVSRWRREDPVMQYLDLVDLRMSRALVMERDPEMVELLSASETPLVAYKDFGGVRRYLVGFSPFVESNWWADRSFVYFLKNVVEQTRLRHYIGMPQVVATGSPAKLFNLGENVADGTKVTIGLPDGSVEEVAVKGGSVQFERTDRAGFYEVTTGPKKSLFAANLLSSSESLIGPKSLETSTGGNVEEATSVVSVNKEVWKWLALAALVILLVEWWVYHRRIA
jgi:hypothetical protein